MKVIVAGSRDVTEFGEVEAAIHHSPWSYEIDEVVSGCARGPDTLAIEWAERDGYDVARFPADWDSHGKAAGIIRNKEMAEYADALIAVWDGKSRGTRSMITEATRRGLPVYVHPVNR